MSNENTAPEVQNETIDETVEGSEETGEVSEESGEESVETAAVEEAVKEAVASGASKKEVQNLIKKFSLKVNGKTVEREFDLSDEKSLQKELQMAAAGREAMQAKAEYEKALTTLVDRLKTDPLGLAEELGLDADEMAAIRLQKRLEESKKSPEQVEAEKMRKEIEAYRKKEQEREIQLKEMEEKRTQEEAIRELDEEIETALNGYTTLPKGSPLVMDLIAKNLNWAMDNHEKFGYEKPEDVRVEHILPSVEADLKKHMNKFFEGVPLDLIQQYIGKQATENLRQQRVNAAKKVNNISNVQKTSASVKSEKKSDQPKVDLKDWMRSAF